MYSLESVLERLYVQLGDCMYSLGSVLERLYVQLGECIKGTSCCKLCSNHIRDTCSCSKLHDLSFEYL